VRLGASGFLLKDVPPAELARSIRIVADGDAVVAPSVTRRLPERFAPHLPDLRQGPGATEDARLSLLTEREREILVEVAGGLSNTEISAKLFVAEATVKTHLGRVWPSWPCATGPRPSFTPTRRAWYGPAQVANRSESR
jgi:DNA-binding NarL/FixJ family response regulator